MRRWWHLPEGWLSLLLLLVMMLTMARSLQQANWARPLQVALGILTPAAALGLLVGFLLAWIRRVPRVLAHVIGVLGGIAWVVQLSGSLRSVAVVGYREPVAFLDPSLQGWKDLAAELLFRMLVLWRTFLRGSTGEDAAMFVVVLAYVCWIVSFLSAWFAFRSRWPWVAVGLSSLIVLLNSFYAPAVPGGYFGFFAFVSLFFLIFYLWRQREERWQHQGVRYPRELSQGIIGVALVLSTILVLGTSLLPTTAGGAEEGDFLDQLLRPWREVRTTWQRLFTNIDSGAPGEGRLGAYGSSFSLGGARITPQGTALEVRSSRNDYLRGITFDQFDGRGWTNTAEHGPLRPLGGLADIPVPRSGRVLVSQIITPRLQGGNQVFAFAEPVSSTLPAVAWLSEPVESLGFPDIVTVGSRSPLNEGQPYRVISLLSVIDKTSLRGAGQDYPEEIRDRYLQLPRSLPQRVRDLADQIVAARVDLEALLQSPPPEGLQITVRFRGDPAGTSVTTPVTMSAEIEQITILVNRPPLQGQTITLQVEEGRVVSVSPTGALVPAGIVSPYDAAEALQGYLRTNTTYKEIIPNPPPNVNLVDYFLFESKEGYCDYFASAMAVLLRTQGIPSRTARGYATGDYDNEIGAYVVPVASAHTWIEVYFPQYGWQRFEPTAADYTTVPLRPENPPQASDSNSAGASGMDNRPDINRGDLGEEDADFVPGPVLPAGAAGLSPGLRWTLFMVAALVLAAFTAWAVVNLRIGYRLGRLSPVAATFERMCRWAGLSRLAAPGQPTPSETASFLGETLPKRQSEIGLIAASYVRERFSQHRLFPQEVVNVRQAWKDLRWPLWGRLVQRLRPTRAPKEPSAEVEE